MSTRTDDATHARFLAYQETQPTAREYYPTRIAVALLGEGIIRAAGWSETLSWKGIDQAIGFSNWIPVVNAQDVADLNEASGIPLQKAAEATATATNWAWCDYLPCTKWNQATDLVSRNWTLVSSYISENSDWIGLTAGFAVTTAAINHLSAGKIKNVYLRNSISLLTSGVAVWAVSNYVVGHQVGANTLADIGLRMVASHSLLKLAAPFAQGAISYTHRAMNGLRWNFSYPSPKATKVKSA